MDEWMDEPSVIRVAVTAVVAMIGLMGWNGPCWVNREEIQTCQGELKLCEARLWLIAKERESVLQQNTALKKMREERNAQIAEMEREFILFDEVTEEYNRHIYSLEAENEELRWGYATSASREIIGNRNRVAHFQGTIERENEERKDLYVHGLEAENKQLRQGYANSAGRQIVTNRRLRDITERINQERKEEAGPRSSDDMDT